MTTREEWANTVDSGGKLRLIWTARVGSRDTTRSMSFGTVTNIHMTYTKTVHPTPIVTQSVDSTFAIENGSALTISFDFARRQPDPEVIDDSLSGDSIYWSNQFWSMMRNEMIDRWQARTDGAILDFEPAYGADGNPYVPGFSKRGYLQNITASYKAGDPTVITGSVVFEVGTMYVNHNISHTTEVMKYSDFSVAMSDPDVGLRYYPLMWYDEENSFLDGCITEMKIYSGLDTPFEYARIIIPRKKLSATAPKLVDKIENGRNIVLLKTMGEAMMTVYSGGSKKVGKDGSYEIIAYSATRQIKECTVGPGDVIGTPMSLITGILNGSYAAGLRYKIDTIITNADDVIYTPDGRILTNRLLIKEGTNAWFALQMCALAIGARVWFRGNKAYVIDYRRKGASGTNYIGYGDLQLYNHDSDSYLHERIVDAPSTGSAGSMIINAVTIQHTNQFDESNTYTDIAIDNMSIERYGKQSLTSTLDLTGIELQYDFSPIPTEEEKEEYRALIEDLAGAIGQVIVEYRAEPQQSVEFTCRELYKSNGEITWSPVFEPACYADSLNDPYNEIFTDNESILRPGRQLPQKLYLFSMVRNYPECTTTYKFGQLASLDLESNNSYLIGKG